MKVFDDMRCWHIFAKIFVLAQGFAKIFVINKQMRGAAIKIVIFTQF